MTQSVLIGLSRKAHVGNDTSIAIVPYFERSIENMNIYYLFIILTGCDLVEPAGPNELGTESSFKIKRFVNCALNSPGLEKQLSVK